MRRPVNVLLPSALLALLASASAHGAVIGAPEFTTQPFTVAAPTAGSAVQATLNWRPPTFSPPNANDKQTVYVTDTAGGSPQVFSAGSTQTSMPLLLTNGHQYVLTVAACNSANPCDPAGLSTSTTQTTRIDATPPTGTVQVNGGAPATNNRTVTLNLSASDPLVGGAAGTSSGVTQAAVDVNGDGTAPCQIFGSPPDTSGCAVAFAPSITATIPPGPDGLRSVGVYFGDGARPVTVPCHPPFCAFLFNGAIEGNSSAEAVDTILLDTVKPVAVAAPASIGIQRGDQVTFSAGGSTDAAPASGVDAGSATWSFADGSPTATGPTVTHAFATAGTFVGSLRVKDVAGNLSDPRAFTVTVSPRPGETVSGSGSISGVRGTAAFSVTRLKVKARYRRSTLIGSVSVTGASSQAGSLRLALRRGTSGRGRVLRSRAAALRSATFTRTLTLPGSLKPGRYTLTLAGPGGVLTTVLTLTPPNEGVLSLARIVRPGPSAKAAFRFAAPPIAKLRTNLTVTWSQGGRVLGVVPVTFATTFLTRLPTGATVTAGPLRATLRAGAIVVGSATGTAR